MEALKLYAEIIPLNLKHHKITEGNTNHFVYNLGKLQLKWKEYADALECFNEALDLFLFESGQSSEKKGDLNGAEFFLSSLVLLREITGKGDVFAVMYRLACVL